MKFKTFETPRLTIRPTTEDDAAFIFELLNSPGWIENIGDRNIKTIEQARIYIREKMTPQLERLGFSNYTLIDKKDHQKVGVCGLYDRAGLEDVDIGFALLPQYEGQGFALEAAKVIRDAAFSEFKLKSIVAITTKSNCSSQRLLEKLGLKSVGTTKLPDSDEELLLYQLRKESGFPSFIGR